RWGCSRETLGGQGAPPATLPPMNVNAKSPFRVGLLVLILVIVSLGRSSSARAELPSPADSKGVPKAGAPPQGVVLTGEDAVVLASEFFYNPPPSAKEIWQPSASDIMRLEKLLPDFMGSQKALPRDYQPLKEYFRQYVGVVRNGKKLIGVNFVH